MVNSVLTKELVLSVKRHFVLIKQGLRLQRSRPTTGYAWGSCCVCAGPHDPVHAAIIRRVSWVRDVVRFRIMRAALCSRMLHLSYTRLNYNSDRRGGAMNNNISDVYTAQISQRRPGVPLLQWWVSEFLRSLHGGLFSWFPLIPATACPSYLTCCQSLVCSLSFVICSYHVARVTTRTYQYDLEVLFTRMD